MFVIQTHLSEYSCHDTFFPLNHAIRVLLNTPPPLSLLSLPSFVATMARSTLSVFVAVASASYVVAQSVLPTFPVTPLASMSFAYPSQVVCAGLVRIFSARLTFVCSPTKPVPVNMFAEHHGGPRSRLVYPEGPWHMVNSCRNHHRRSTT
jgi:hypothetical protein